MSNARSFKKAPSKPAAGGAGKKGFSAIANFDSDDSDTEKVVVAPNRWDYTAFFREDREYQELAAALRSGTRLWGDICFPAGIATPVAAAKPKQTERPLLTELEFLSKDFAAGLEQPRSDLYVCKELSDADWEAMMRWLYSAGWEITHESRLSVTAYPDNQPPREWIPPSRFDLLAESKPQMVNKPKVKKTGAMVPKFCRNGTACTDEGCCWVHGDTLPVLNKVCGFDGKCSGEKRVTCCYLHPSEGEIWSETLVRHRPAAAVVIATPPPEWAAIEKEIAAELQPEIDAFVNNLDEFNVEAV